MNPRGRVKSQIWGGGLKCYMVVYRKNLSKSFYKNQMKIMPKHLFMCTLDSSLFKSWPPGQDRATTGEQNFTHLYSVSLCCSGEWCDPWTSYFMIFWCLKTAKSCRKDFGFQYKMSLKNQFCADKNCILVGQLHTYKTGIKI